MPRSEATRRLLGVMERLCESGGADGALGRVWIFGSYSRGAMHVGDVDLWCEPADPEEWSMQEVESLMGGRHPVAALKAVLRPGRKVSIHPGEVPPRGALLLWRAGDDLDVVRARITDISIDPSAGPVRRKPWPEPFEALRHYLIDERIAMHAIENLKGGFISVEHLVLDGSPRPSNLHIGRGRAPAPRRVDQATHWLLEQHGVGHLRHDATVARAIFLGVESDWVARGDRDLAVFVMNPGAAVRPLDVVLIRRVGGEPGTADQRCSLRHGPRVAVVDLVLRTPQGMSSDDPTPDWFWPGVEKLNGVALVQSTSSGRAEDGSWSLRVAFEDLAPPPVMFDRLRGPGPAGFAGGPIDTGDALAGALLSHMPLDWELLGWGWFVASGHEVDTVRPLDLSDLPAP